MSDATHNSGWIMQGGTVNVDGAFAIGKDAKALYQASSTVLPQSTREELQQQLRELQQKIDQQRERLAEPDTACQVTEDILDELDHPAPNRPRLQELLGRLAEISQPVA